MFLHVHTINTRPGLAHQKIIPHTIIILGLPIFSWMDSSLQGLTLSQTKNYRLFQTKRVCRGQFERWRKWQKVFQKDKKHCRKRGNCLFRAIFPFPIVFSKDLCNRHVKTRERERVKIWIICIYWYIFSIINPRKEYWPSRGSNQQPPVLKSAMLPTELMGLSSIGLRTKPKCFPRYICFDWLIKWMVLNATINIISVMLWQ